MKAKIWALALATTAMAMTSRAQVSTTFGLRAGVNFTNLNGEDANGDDLDYKIKTGFHIGVNAEVPIAPEFYLQPGVLFSTKGIKYDDDDDVTLNISYIEIPINFLYKPVLGTGKLLLGVGPYVGFGIGGKWENKDADMERDVKFENEITLTQYGSGDPYVKRLDVGGNLLAGYEFSNKFSIQLNAQLGMTDIASHVENDSDNDGKMKNTGFGVSLGYRF